MKARQAKVPSVDFKYGRYTLLNSMNIRVGRTLFHLIFFVVCEAFFITVFAVLLIYYGPFNNVRNYVVSTVMGTSSDHFLATTFLSMDKINNIISENTPIIKNAVEIPGNINITNKVDKSIEIIEINENHFKGRLILVKDPRRITVGLAPELGFTGALLREIIKENNAIGGINAGGFFDDNVMGTGGKPVGIVVSGNKIVSSESGKTSFNVIGFNNDNILIVSNGMTLDEIKNTNLRCAISFGPAIIINGQPLIQSGGKTLQPRSAIGQKKDGTVMLLAIDGRRLTSKGASYEDLQHVLLKYGAYNAANLDGGSSTTLIFRGKTINNPCDILGERSIPSAFLIMP